MAEYDFSRVLPLEGLIGRGGTELDLLAGEAERRSVAAFLGLVALGQLTGRCRLSWEDPGRVLRLDGSLVAAAVQACVVTLEPVPARIEAAFVRRWQLGPAEAARQEAAEAPGIEREVELDPDEDEPLERLEGDPDLGAVLVEELSLNLDPYPRRPGVDFSGFVSGSLSKPLASLSKLLPENDGGEDGGEKGGPAA